MRFKHLALILVTGLGVSCSQSGVEAQQAVAVTESVEIQSNWIVDKSQSSISFTGSMSGDVFTGSFAGFDAAIQFDPNNLDEARIKVSVDMAGADTGDAERNDALPGKEWFAVNAFPTAVFEASTVKKTGDSQYEAIGNLTIKDVTRPLTLPFTLDIEDGVANAKAQTAINRTDFGVGTGMWKSEDMVAHKVGIMIAITATHTE